MDVNDIKHLAVERIYLVPDASEGVLGYVWCDDPAPGIGMQAGEAVEYVRKDVHDARIAELEEREQALAAYIDRLSKAVEACMSDDERKFVFTPDDYTELESALETKFSDSLARRDEESMRKGFWWGFERARMHPDENNILAQWEDVKALKRRNESVRQERAQQ